MSNTKQGGLPSNTHTKQGTQHHMLEIATSNSNNKTDIKPKSNQTENSMAPHPNETSAESGISDTSHTGGTAATNAAGRKYERRTKRFIWPDELHRLFVAAVFDVGLKNASPKALLTLMGAPACMSGLTTEHLKSHLQKYRLNYDRSRVEFLKFFDESVNESNKQQKRKGKVLQQGAVTSLFPIIPKRRRSSDNEDQSSDDDEPQDEKVAKVVAPLTRKIDAQSEALRMQAQFQEEIQQQLYEQVLLQRQLQERLAEVTVRKGDSPINGQLPHPVMALTQQPLPRGTSFNNVGQAKTFPPPTSRSSSNPLQDQLTQLAQLEEQQKDRGMQWNLSLMPTGSTMLSNLGPNMDSVQSSNTSNANGFSIEQQNASHIQMQLAMQQQMRLHQQMLIRKVEVSQSSTGGNNTNVVGSGSNNATATTNATHTSTSSVASVPPPTSRESFRDQLAGGWPDHKDDDQGSNAADANMSEVFAWDSIDVDMNDDLFGFLK